MEDWTPCAIGAAPSAFDCNGALSCCQQPDTDVTPNDAVIAHVSLPPDAQPSRGAASQRSTAQHMHTDTPLSRQMADPVERQPIDSQRVSMLCADADEEVYLNVWESFAYDIQTDNKQSKPSLSSLITYPKTIKVL